MNQRPLPADLKFIPKRKVTRQPDEDRSGHAEEILFSKAEVASAVEQLQGKIKKLKDQLNAEPVEGEEAPDRDELKTALGLLTEELEQARELAKAEVARDKGNHEEEDESTDEPAQAEEQPPKLKT